MILRAAASAAIMHARGMLRRPDAWLPLATAPVAAVTIYLLLVAAGRTDLVSVAIVGPGLMALLQVCVGEAGEILAVDRGNGMLEQTFTSRAGLLPVVLGRLVIVVVVGFLGLLEAGVLVWLLSGGGTVLHHPGVLIVTLIATMLGYLGAALPLVSLLLLARGTRVVQNSVTWPVFLLSGVLVPVTLLPSPLQVVSPAIFLTWSAELMRSSFSASPVDHIIIRVGAVLALAAAMASLGVVLLRQVVHRLRVTARISLP